MGQCLVLLQLDIPWFINIHEDTSLSETETEEWIERWNMGGVEGGTGLRGGRGNCSEDEIYEKRINKKIFQHLPQAPRWAPESSTHDFCGTFRNQIITGKNK